MENALLWPFKSKFLIIDLDEEYEITVIGHPSKKYVWVMARTQKLKIPNILQLLIIFFRLVMI